MKLFFVISLLFLNTILPSQDYCDFNFGYNWITTQLNYSENDTAKCIFDKVDTIDFIKDLNSYGKVYQYIELNCKDSCFMMYSIDSIKAMDNVCKSKVVWIVGISDVDKGIWSTSPFHNTISFIIDNLNICYTFQIIKEEDKIRLIKIKKE